MGSKAFQDVLKSAYGEVITNEELFISAKGSKEFGKLANIWQKTKKLVDGVISANKSIDGFTGMADKAVKLLEFIDKLNV